MSVGQRMLELVSLLQDNRFEELGEALSLGQKQIRKWRALGGGSGKQGAPNFFSMDLRKERFKRRRTGPADKVARREPGEVLKRHQNNIANLAAPRVTAPSKEAFRKVHGQQNRAMFHDRREFSKKLKGKLPEGNDPTSNLLAALEEMRGPTRGFQRAQRLVMKSREGVRAGRNTNAAVSRAARATKIPRQFLKRLDPSRLAGLG